MREAGTKGPTARVMLSLKCEFARCDEIAVSQPKTMQNFLAAAEIVQGGFHFHPKDNDDVPDACTQSNRQRLLVC